MNGRRLWAVGALLVGVGWLLTPNPVPVYDGIGVPDEPYRYVTSPEGGSPTAPPSEATARTPVVKGVSKDGLVLQTKEQTAQFSMFMPPGAMAATTGPITIRAVPQDPVQSPAGKKIFGNAYLITLTSPGGPVTLTKAAEAASLYQRATDTSDGWAMHFRPTANAPWEALQTSRGGTDSHVADFIGPGEYALAKAASQASDRGGLPVLPLAIGIVLLVLVVVAIRLRSTPG